MHSFDHAHVSKKQLFPSNWGGAPVVDFCASEAHESFKPVRPAVVRADHNQCHMSEHVTENTALSSTNTNLEPVTGVWGEREKVQKRERDAGHARFEERDEKK